MVKKSTVATGLGGWVIRTSSWLVVGVLAYMMLRPVSNNRILVPAVALLFIASLVLLRVRARVSNALVLVVLLVLTVGIYGLLIGMGNPGMIYGGLVWIAAPIVFGTFAAAGDETMVRRILWISALTTVLTSLYVLAYVGGVNHVIPEFIPNFVISQMGPDPDPSTRVSTDIRLYSLSTLVATVPMWLTATLLPGSQSLPPKWLSATAGILGVAAALNSGRATLVVVVVMVPVVMWMIWRIVARGTPRNWWRKVAPIGVAALAGILFVWLMTVSTFVGRTWDRVSGVVTGKYASPDDRLRGQQADYLVEAWRESPVFGHGWGAVIEGYSRTDNRRPWNFELQYHLILFQVGLVGVFLLLLAVVIVLWCIIVVTRRRPESRVAILVVTSGALSLLIANGSNPYLQAPGNMWPLYLLLMIINVNLLAGSSREGAGQEATTAPDRVTEFLTRTIEIPHLRLRTLPH